MPLLGTPFPASEVSDRRRFVPVWRQEARDEAGRRRFHGAFTGGFSAGYHNTVGSRDGWTPAAYVSSRTARHQAAADARAAEQYMDEEDLGDLRRQVRLVAAAPFEGAADALVARKEGLGWTLLRRMGWRGRAHDAGPAAQLLAAAAAGRGGGEIGRDPRAASGAGFGTSVLEDGDDDEDIYHTPSASASASFVDSIAVREPDEKPPAAAPPAAPRQTREEAKDLLAGFVRASAASAPAAVSYAPPAVPKDFVPRALGTGPPSGPVRRGDAKLTPEARGSILGERLLVRPVQAADRAAGRTALDVPAAVAALRGYMPFQSDPAKDARYRRFLLHHSAPHAAPPPERPEAMTHAEFVREQEDFCKAAAMYRPLPAAMASKFVPSKKGPAVDPSALRVGLYRPDPAAKPKPEAAAAPADPAPLPAAETPALAYGSGTRTEALWTPSSLLCKRYSLEPPHKDAAAAAAGAAPSLLSLQAVQRILSDSTYADKVTMAVPADSVAGGERPAEAAEISEKLERPPMDLFRAIFGIDDSSAAGADQDPSPAETGRALAAPAAEPLPADSRPADRATSEQKTERPPRHTRGRPRAAGPQVLYMEENVFLGADAEHRPRESAGPLAPAHTAPPAAREYGELMGGRRKKRPAASDLW